MSKRFFEPYHLSDPETKEVFDNLLGKLFLVTVTVGAVSTGASLLRLFLEGWVPNIILDVVAYFLALGLLAFRKRLPDSIFLPFLFGILILYAGLNLFTAGLPSMSFLIFTVVGVFAGVFLGFAYAVFIIGVSLFISILFGVLTLSGIYVNPHDYTSYFKAPQVWITQIAGFAFFSLSILFCVNSIQQRLRNTLAAVKRKAEELRQSEQKYRMIAEGITDVLFIQNLDFTFSYISPSVQKLSGYTPEEVKSLPLEKFVAPSSLEKVHKVYTEALSHAYDRDLKLPLFQFEYVRKDGSTFWGELQVGFLHDKEGHPIGSQGILRDISERLRMEKEQESLRERLRQSEKLETIGRLASGIAHDFNNQITGIVGFAELLKERLGNQPELLEKVENILKTADRTSDLVKKLMSFARKENGGMSPVDVHFIIDEVLTILLHSVDKRIQVLKRIQAGNAVVNGDASLISSALLNLCLNACDAMPRGGVLEISTRVVGSSEAIRRCGLANRSFGQPGYLQIDIKDTGVGMTKEVMDKAFEPFFTTKERGKGTGMGLATVVGMVRSHDGCVDVESELGKGTVFHIVLPLIG